MKTLTHRQAEILAFIQQSIREAGLPPTIAEIASAFELRSPNAVRDHLRALQRKGAIDLIPGISRGIRLPVDDVSQHNLPVVGRVAAGSPILAQQHIESHYDIDPGLFTPRADYLLRVHGSSMRDAGILDGDLLAVYRSQEAQPGQIAVVRIEDEVTVKRWQRRGHSVQLLPENPDFQPIVIDLRNTPVFIEGIGVGVIRNRPL